MEKIPENTFIYMNNLTYLHLDWNNITSISKYTFEGLSNLKYLYMIRNLLTKIEEGNYNKDEGSNCLLYCYLNHGLIFHRINESFYGFRIIIIFTEFSQRYFFPQF